MIVRHCGWCGGEPLVRHHPDGDAEHRHNEALWLNELEEREARLEDWEEEILRRDFEAGVYRQADREEEGETWKAEMDAEMDARAGGNEGESC